MMMIRAGISISITGDRLQTLKERFTVTFDTAFEKTLRQCQEMYNLKDQMSNKWLSERAFRTFLELFQQGYAHSVEVWQDAELVGGLFGVAIGKIFFGEYVFGRVQEADEFAVLSLIKKLKDQQFHLIDMQKPTVFFEGLEYDELSRMAYVDTCKKNAETYVNNAMQF